MLSIRTLLYPSDFSKPAEAAFQFACSQARRSWCLCPGATHLFPEAGAWDEVARLAAD